MTFHVARATGRRRTLAFQRHGTDACSAASRPQRRQSRWRSARSHRRVGHVACRDVTVSSRTGRLWLMRVMYRDDGPPSRRAMTVGVHIEIRGTVQGVGFRPWVYRVAHELGVTGRVRNHARGVTIEAFGGEHVLERLVTRIGE